ncbi:hypothetical protein [Candidatus Alkanophaga liquidiphilum]
MVSKALNIHMVSGTQVNSVGCRVVSLNEAVCRAVFRADCQIRLGYDYVFVVSAVAHDDFVAGRCVVHRLLYCRAAVRHVNRGGVRGGRQR